MNVLVYSKDLCSQDERLASMRVGDRFVRHFNKYGREIANGGYEYATLMRLDDGRLFKVRLDKLDEHFEIEADDAE